MIVNLKVLMLSDGAKVQFDYTVAFRASQVVMMLFILSQPEGVRSIRKLDTI